MLTWISHMLHTPLKAADRIKSCHELKLRVGKHKVEDTRNREFKLRDECSRGLGRKEERMVGDELEKEDDGVIWISGDDVLDGGDGGEGEESESREIVGVGGARCHGGFSQACVSNASKDGEVAMPLAAEDPSYQCNSRSMNNAQKDILLQHLSWFQRAGENKRSRESETRDSQTLSASALQVYRIQ